MAKAKMSLICIIDLPSNVLSKPCLAGCHEFEPYMVIFTKVFPSRTNPKNMIRSHIGSLQSCRVLLKLERFSHIQGRSFGLDSSIRLGYLLLVLSLRFGM